MCMALHKNLLYLNRKWDPLRSVEREKKNWDGSLLRSHPLPLSWLVLGLKQKMRRKKILLFSQVSLTRDTIKFAHKGWEKTLADTPVQNLRSNRTEILSTPLLSLLYVCMAQFQDFSRTVGFWLFFFFATQCSYNTLILKSIYARDS